MRHEQIDPARTRTDAPLQVQARIADRQDRRPPRDDPDGDSRGPRDLPLPRLDPREQARGGRQGVLIEVEGRGTGPRRRTQDLLRDPARKGGLRGHQEIHGVLRHHRGGAERPQQPELLPLVVLLGAAAGGEGPPRMPPGPPHTCPRGRLRGRDALHGAVRLQGPHGDQAGDPQVVRPAGGRGRPQEMAQRGRRLVHGPALRPEGAPLPPVQVGQEEGGGQARLDPEVHADGLPRRGVPRHRVRARGRPRGREPVPRRGEDEPPHGGDRDRQEAPGLVPGRPGHVRGRARVRDNARQRQDRRGARRGPRRLRGGCGHGRRPGQVHDGQRAVRGGPHLSPQMQRRDAEDRVPVPSGRGSRDGGRGPQGARRNRRRRGGGLDGRVLEEGPPAQVPIRGRGWT